MTLCSHGAPACYKRAGALVDTNFSLLEESTAIPTGNTRLGCPGEQLGAPAHMHLRGMRLRVHSGVGQTPEGRQDEIVLLSFKTVEDRRWVGFAAM